jgi:CO/xanthine dehydrogenase FAD-binding subunit
VNITVPTRLAAGSVELRPLRFEDAAAYAEAFRADPELVTAVRAQTLRAPPPSV